MGLGRKDPVVPCQRARVVVMRASSGSGSKHPLSHFLVLKPNAVWMWINDSCSTLQGLVKKAYKLLGDCSTRAKFWKLYFCSVFTQTCTTYLDPHCWQEQVCCILPLQSDSKKPAGYPGQPHKHSIQHCVNVQHSRLTFPVQFTVSDSSPLCCDLWHLTFPGTMLDFL